MAALLGVAGLLLGSGRLLFGDARTPADSAAG